MTRTVTQICTLFLLVVLAVPAFAGKFLADIEYFYADDGTLIGKAFNGKRVNFEYDLRGQLLAVRDISGGICSWKMMSRLSPVTWHHFTATISKKTSASWIRHWKLLPRKSHHSIILPPKI